MQKQTTQPAAPKPKQQNKQKRPPKTKVTFESPFTNPWKATDTQKSLDIIQLLKQFYTDKPTNSVKFGVNEVTKLLEQNQQQLTPLFKPTTKTDVKIPALILIADANHKELPPIQTNHIKIMCCLQKRPFGVLDCTTEQLSIKKNTKGTAAIAILKSTETEKLVEKILKLLPESEHGNGIYQLPWQTGVSLKPVQLGTAKPIPHKRKQPPPTEKNKKQKV